MEQSFVFLHEVKPSGVLPIISIFFFDTADFDDVIFLKFGFDVENIARPIEFQELILGVETYTEFWEWATFESQGIECDFILAVFTVTCVFKANILGGIEDNFSIVHTKFQFIALQIRITCSIGISWCYDRCFHVEWESLTCFVFIFFTGNRSHGIFLAIGSHKFQCLIFWTLYSNGHFLTVIAETFILDAQYNLCFSVRRVFLVGSQHFSTVFSVGFQTVEGFGYHFFSIIELNFGLVDFHASALHLKVEGDAIAHVGFFSACKGYDSRAAMIIELVNLIFA